MPLEMVQRMLRRILCFGVLSCVIHALAQDIDSRKSGVQCNLDSATQKVTCDYRFPFNVDVKDVSLKVGGQPIQLEQSDISVYPAEGQTTAILFLVDVSDARRKNTVEKKNVRLIADMLAQQQAHQSD